MQLNNISHLPNAMFKIKCCSIIFKIRIVKFNTSKSVMSKYLENPILNNAITQSVRPFFSF